MQYVLCIVCMLAVVINTAVVSSESEYNDSLKLIHVIFRHGDKTPYRTYPKDCYKNEDYYPYGMGQLTNKGKQKMYMLGKVLRKRYNSFLGSTYIPDMLNAVSTQIDRAKMSLELVLAGLFPPKGTVSEWERVLNWQPIPYNSLLFANDNTMSPPIYFCPNYMKQYQTYLVSPAGVQLLEKYREMFDYLSENTGLDIKSMFNITNTYDVLTSQKEWGLQLPQWTHGIYPEHMKEATLDAYTSSVATPKLRKFTAFLLKKIVSDTQSKINKTLAPEKRKIFLYSGHDFNILYLLNSLETLIPHIPPYGACVLIELHKINNEYGIKIFYQDYTEMEPKILKIPGCESFCLFTKFIKLVDKNLPTNEKCNDD